MCLLVLLVLALRYDIGGYRIPNTLVYGGALLGVLLNSCLPGGLGPLAALQGLSLALLLLLPAYGLGAMGAGDVKLLAMVGAFLGPWQVLGVLLATFLAGGMLALWMLLHHRRRPVLVDAPKITLPYAVAIAAGTLAYLLWQGLR